MFDYRPGDVSARCDRCGGDVAPVVELYLRHADDVSVWICISCLAESIDAVTGWHFARQVDMALAASPASARFRDPSSRVRKGRPRRPLLDSGEPE